MTKMRARKHQATVSHTHTLLLNGDACLFLKDPKIASNCLRACQTKNAGSRYCIPAPAYAPVMPTKTETKEDKTDDNIKSKSPKSRSPTLSKHRWKEKNLKMARDDIVMRQRSILEFGTLQSPT